MIRVNSREEKVISNHKNNRISTSAKKGKEHIVNSKLDPTFFKLFAK